MHPIRFWYYDDQHKRRRYAEFFWAICCWFFENQSFSTLLFQYSISLIWGWRLQYRLRDKIQSSKDLTLKHHCETQQLSMATEANTFWEEWNEEYQRWLRLNIAYGLIDWFLQKLEGLLLGKEGALMGLVPIWNTVRIARPKGREDKLQGRSNLW